MLHAKGSYNKGHNMKGLSINGGRNLKEYKVGDIFQKQKKQEKKKKKKNARN